MHAPESIPLFLRIAAALKQRLADGHYPLGIPLPGERALASEWGVARVTIRSALQRLQEEGLITRLRGVGTMPVATVAAANHTQMHTGLLQSIVSFGQRTRTKVISYAYEPASPEVAQALRLPPAARVLKIVRVRTAHKVPLQCTEVYLPEAVATLIARSDLTEMPVLSLIEKAGRHFDHGEQGLQAVIASASIEALLQVPAGTPLLRIERVVFDADKQPLQYLIGHYASNHYQYKMSMSRTGGGTRVWITA